MAALTYLLSHMLSDLWSLTDELVNNGGNLSQAVHQLRVQERDRRFHQLCRELWQRHRLKLQQEQLRQLEQQQQLTEQRNNRSVRQLKSAKNNKCSNMNRSGIDFAAIEASAEAFEVIDDFAVSAGKRRPTGVNSAGINDFLSGERQHLDWQECVDDIEVIDGITTSFYEYLDALPLYEDNNIAPLHEGVSYTFSGYVLPDCERFSINFLLPEGDTALHINPRLPQNYIVRNSKVRDTWGREEVSSPLPFSLRRGAKFSIQVLVTDACYMISVNGQHFAEYNHRLPYKDINGLQVKGDIEHVQVERSTVQEYPERLPNTRPREIRFDASTQQRKAVLATKEDGTNDENYDDIDGTAVPKSFRIVRTKSVIMPSNSPAIHGEDGGFPMPFYGALPIGSLYTGRCLKIEGRVKLLPHSFYINLQQGQNIWPHPLIAFHFNPRFAKQSGAIGKAIVCRNAWFNGDWGKEDRSELDTDLRPGKMFSLAIVCVADAFEVYVNHKYITEFKYQLQPDVVDMVYVQGDIKLWQVVLAENSLLDCGKKRLYQNPTYVDDY